MSFPNSEVGVSGKRPISAKRRGASDGLPRRFPRGRSRLHTGADGRVRLLREDMGRHNALDKLIGAMHRGGHDPCDRFAVVTSRASHEMAMKAAGTGIVLLAAISAPTALAISLAEVANLTLIGFARDDGYAAYTHPWRIVPVSGASA